MDPKQLEQLKTAHVIMSAIAAGLVVVSEKNEGEVFASRADRLAAVIAAEEAKQAQPAA